MTRSDRTTETWRPSARRTDLTVEDHGDVLRIFDRRAEQAHELSPTAARLWRAADGTRTVDELVALVVEDGVPPALARELVDVALADFDERNLVEPPPAPRPLVSRRDILARVGVFSAAAASFGIASCLPQATTAPPTTQKPTKTAKPSKAT